MSGLHCESVIPRGIDLSRHYKNNTNFDMLKQLKECVGDKELESLKSKADKPTLYMLHAPDDMPFILQP